MNFQESWAIVYIVVVLLRIVMAVYRVGAKSALEISFGKYSLTRAILDLIIALGVLGVYA